MSPSASNGLDLRPILFRLWDARVRVVLVTVAAGLVGVLLAVALPKWYRASAVILPPEESDLLSNMGVMGRALGKFPTFGEFGEYSTPADIYKAILKSRSLQDEIVQRFGLLSTYHAASPDAARRKFASLSAVKLNPDGTIGVTVEDRDPRRAAQMVGAMIEGLDRFNISKRSTQGRRTREFLEHRVAETDSALLASEAALREYQERHRAAVAASAADVPAAADLMARKLALEVRIGVLAGYSRESSDQLVQARRELAELEHQIAKLPAMQSDLARMIRDAKVQEQLYLLLVAELEDARVKEMRDTPTVTVLDAPLVPERPARPRKLVFGLAATFIGFVAVIGWELRPARR